MNEPADNQTTRRRRSRRPNLIPIGVWRPGEYLSANSWADEADRDYGWLYAGLAMSQVWRGSPKGRRPPAFRLTHCGTGHSVCIIEAHEAEAFLIAERVAKLGDWDFDGLDGWKNRDPELLQKVKELLSSFGKKVRLGGGGRGSHEAARAVAIARAT